VGDAQALCASLEEGELVDHEQLDKAIRVANGDLPSPQYGSSATLAQAPTIPPVGPPMALSSVRAPAVGASAGMAVSAIHTLYPRAGKRRKAKKGEINTSLGPSQTPRWSKMPNETSIRVVQKLAPQSLFSTSISTPTFGGLIFQVSALGNFASLSAVYDQYRIDRIEVLIYNDDQTSATPATAPGTFMSVVDVDDGATPTSLLQLGGYSSCVETPGNQSHFHAWQPQFAISAYSGAFTSFASSTGWVDCASSSVQYYGIKYGSTATPIVVDYSAVIEYVVSFRTLH